MSHEGAENARERSDAELVEAARAGDERAFDALVVRYQGLVCSVAYALTTSFSRSEEIAQEVFLSAWKRLHELRRPEKVRSWLLAIARNRSLTWRKQGEVLAGGGGRPGQRDVPSVEPSPLDSLISREEELALRQALEAIPETYRLPIVLFYREQSSVEKVALALNISRKSVTMRLTRARRMLKEEVAVKLESALERTRPGRRFTTALASALLVAGAPEGVARAARPLAAVVKTGASVGAAAVAVLALVGGAAWLGPPSGETGRRTKITRSGAGARSAGGPPLFQNAAFVVAADEEPPPAARQADRRRLLPARAGGRREFHMDFEDGRHPPTCGTGQVVPCPHDSKSLFCVTGSASLGWNLNAVTIYTHKEHIRHSRDVRLSFDYWVPAEVHAVDIELGDASQRTNYDYAIYEPVHEAWAHAIVWLSSFRPNPESPLDAPLLMEEGDHISKIEIDAGRVGDKPFYIDNIRVWGD